MEKIYTTKISKSVSMYVSMYGYVFGRTLRTGQRNLRAYYQSDPTKGQRSSRGQVALEMPYGHQIW